MIWMTRAALCCWLAAMALWTQAAPNPMRLTDQVTPLAYRLALTVDPDQPRHSGEVSIDVDIKTETPVIRLHASRVEVSTAELTMAGQVYPATVTVGDQEQIELRFALTLPVGRAMLRLRFDGRIEDKASRGLFRQKEGGDWYAFTQFEASAARRAFPAFDEPGWKVPWTLVLTIPDRLSAFSNTAVAREVALSAGMKRLEFLTTKPLPSYLVAFGVGPFDVLDGGMAGRTPVRFITPRGRAAEASYAASMTPAILGQLEAYFGQAYPYDKLDVMAMPITLGFGAMENPGLVTFSSRLLLAKPGQETVNFRRSFVAVQAHELAHQWFGNYVTMAWWDDLWLNESFASWMGDKITDQVMPEWHFDAAVQQARAHAMRTDRLASARRIHQPVQDAEALASAFDSITYSKGQATLAMFEGWLGVERFRAGVRRYLSQHAWVSASGEDFVSALSAGDGELANALRSFTEQPGIPRVSVTLNCDAKPTLKLAQSRFLPRGSEAAAGSVWHVPLVVRTPGGSVQVLLKEANGSLSLPDAVCPAWVEANANGAGYYRPVYAPGQLLRRMREGDSSVNEILANLDDAKALSESGDLPLSEALTLALRYAGHPRREVVDAALSMVSAVAPLIAGEQREDYAALWQRAFGERARALGLIGRGSESDDDRLLRARWLVHLVQEGRDQGLRVQARQLAQAWLKDRSTLSGADRALVLRSAAVDGDRPLFDALVQAVLSSKDRVERGDIYNALARFEMPELALAARQLWLSKEHDIRELLTVGRDRNNTETVGEGLLSFMSDNFAAIAVRLPAETVSRLPRYFSGFCAVDKADQVAQFAVRVAGLEGGASTLKQTLETIRLCAAYRDLQQADLAAFLLRR